MKKFSVVFSAFMLLLGLSGIAGAYTIDYAFTASASGNNFQSNYDGDPGFKTEYFNSAVIPLLPPSQTLPTTGTTFTWAGDGAIRKGDEPGVSSAPMGVDGINKDITKFITVPTNTAGPNTAYATNLGGTYNYFGIWWGSADTYNLLEFYNGVNLVASIDGTQAFAPAIANGDQGSPLTNRYVNIYDLPFFDSFRMTSNQFAFEADNITVGTIPEPGTMMLLGSGLVGLAGWGRKKFRK